MLAIAYGFTINRKENYNKRLIVDSCGFLARQLSNGWQSSNPKHRRQNIKKANKYNVLHLNQTKTLPNYCIWLWEIIKLVITTTLVSAKLYYKDLTVGFTTMILKTKLKSDYSSIILRLVGYYLFFSYW